MTTATLPMLDGAAPLVGHLLEFFRDPVAVLKRGYKTKGRLFSFSIMGRRMNVMLGPEHNKFFFEETDKLLSIRESMPFFLKMFSPDFYSFAEMEEYLKQRAIIMPRFKAASMKQYVGIMAEESIGLVERLGDEHVRAAVNFAEVEVPDGCLDVVDVEGAEPRWRDRGERLGSK